jgi:hypothetical protein
MRVPEKAEQIYFEKFDVRYLQYGEGIRKQKEERLSALDPRSN